MGVEHNRLESEVADILLANGSFYRASPQDESLYLIDPATLATLAYTIIQFAANVFGATLPVAAGIRWAYKKYFPKETAASPAQVTVPPKLPAPELRSHLERLKTNTQDTAVRQQLDEDLKSILLYHGWPAAEADADAQRIATALTKNDDARS